MLLNRVLMACAVVASSAMTGACASNEGVLNDDYGIIIKDASMDHVYASKNLGSDKNIVVIPDQIVGWIDLGATAVFKQMKIEQYDCVDGKGRNQLVSIRTSVEQFWLADRASKEVVGPMNKKDLIEKLGLQNVPDIPQLYPYDVNEDRSILAEMKSCR